LKIFFFLGMGTTPHPPRLRSAPSPTGEGCVGACHFLQKCCESKKITTATIKNSHEGQITNIKQREKAKAYAKPSPVAEGGPRSGG
jgi:hypothetical protein